MPPQGPFSMSVQGPDALMGPVWDKNWYDSQSYPAEERPGDSGQDRVDCHPPTAGLKSLCPSPSPLVEIVSSLSVTYSPCSFSNAILRGVG